MTTILVFLLVNFVNFLLIVLHFCMFGRAIMSWFNPDEENKLARFLYFVTEPIVSPVRRMITRLGLFSGLPIDISFLVAFLLIWIIQMAMPPVTL